MTGNHHHVSAGNHHHVLGSQDRCTIESQEPSAVMTASARARLGAQVERAGGYTPRGGALGLGLAIRPHCALATRHRFYHICQYGELYKLPKSFYERWRWRLVLAAV